jgi:hypothetical protein
MPRVSLAAAMAFQNFRAVQALNLVMACVVPAAVVAVGVAAYDVIHIALVVGLLIALLTTTLRLKPALSSGDGGGGRSVGVQLLRVYSAVVLLAMFAIKFATIVGSSHFIKPFQGVLQILGLWHPSVVDMFSFAILLAMVRNFFVDFALSYRPYCTCLLCSILNFEFISYLCCSPLVKLL